ncbi:MAG: Hsp20/alpha crystallin family protein [Planctomycetaceae bacterium]
MSQFPWKPIRLPGNLEQQIDQAFDELIRRRWGMGPASSWQPEIDVYETADAYLVEADVPGVMPEDIRVDVDGHSLTISGLRRTATVEQSAHSVRVERRQGRFSRRFHLEHSVDPTRVKRTHTEGTLHLVIPKRTS